MSANYGVYRLLSIEPHPGELAVIIKFMKIGQPEESRKVVQLKDLSAAVDVSLVANLVLAKCPMIPAERRDELEQVLYYLQKRGSSLGSATSSAGSRSNSAKPKLRVDMSKVSDYIELLYEDIPEKLLGAQSICELSNSASNLTALADNDTLIGAIVRVFREDWKKSFDLATSIMSTFYNFSKYEQFQELLVYHKVGGLCLSTLEIELKRAEAWKSELVNADEKTAKKTKSALKKQSQFLRVCLEILTNMANDLNVEVKMIRRELVPLLVRYFDHPQSYHKAALVAFLLKLSVFSENYTQMVELGVPDKLLAMFPINDRDIAKWVIRLLFNFSFEKRIRMKLIRGGLVQRIIPLLQGDSKALNLLYQLSIEDEAKALIAYNDAIPILMRELLSGNGSDVTKAVLVNACIEKRNAQLVCGADGQGLGLLLDSALREKDLVVMKIARNIALHDGPTQAAFTKWIPQLIDVVMRDGTQEAEERAAFALECAGIAALMKEVNWAAICTEKNLIEWIGGVLETKSIDLEPLQLQLIIMLGTMAKQIESARLLVPLMKRLFQLVHEMQEDDEILLQLLYLFLQMLRHTELANSIMDGDSSVLGDYVIDLMHDKNATVRGMCENAIAVIGRRSKDWARRVTAERFRFHNGQWLELIENGMDAHLDFQEEPDDDYANDMLFDDLDEDVPIFS